MSKNLTIQEKRLMDISVMDSVSQATNSPCYGTCVLLNPEEYPKFA